jgi:hypothetical protein
MPGGPKMRVGIGTSLVKIWLAAYGGFAGENQGKV